MAYGQVLTLAEMGGGLIAAIVAGVVLLLIIIWFIAVHNGLVRQRMQVKNGWSQIDVQLKRRHDLIPNLVEAVKGYMGFEKETLENVTKARASAMGGAGKGPGVQAGLENALTGALGKLYVVMENYPDLKANQNVMQLQEELTATENRIAFARQHYNDQVMRYNTAIRQIPKNIVAGFCGFTKEDFFEIEESDREVPKVDLKLG
ncbi:MAG: LemA family protein [Planctomycetota bacterium]|jgi:LemA protein